jgi:toxin ParE1/3/4
MIKRKEFDVEWAQSAHSDLTAITEHIAVDNVDLALSVLEKLEKRAASLRTMPKRGRIVPELAAIGIHGYRELVHTPWRIVYRIAGRKVRVLAVVDSRRNLEDLLLQRLLR